MELKLGISFDSSQLERELDEMGIDQLMLAYCCAGCDYGNMVEIFELRREGFKIVYGMRLKRRGGG